jgi:hypothetical protein
MTQLFYYHVGAEGALAHFPRSMATRHTGQSLRRWFERDLEPEEGQRLADRLDKRFPHGFHCWGVPTGGRRAFDMLGEGDIVLFIGKIQMVPYPDGMFEYATRVELKYRGPLSWTSQHIWGEARWPLLFFFEALNISFPWPTFLAQVGYSPNCSPGGRLCCVKAARHGMLPGGNPDAYLQYILEHYP